MNPSIQNRRQLIGAAAATLLAPWVPAGAQTARAPISTRPLKITLGFAAGTALDIVVRTIGPLLEPYWPGGVVPDNRPGAGGGLGVSAVISAPPDGSNILYATVSETLILPSFQAKPTFDSSLLVPICQVTTGSLELICGAQKGYRSLQELVNETKGKDKLFVGTFGPGTAHHLMTILMASTLKRPIEPVHYRTPGDMLTDIVSGQLDAAFTSPTVALGWLQAGKIRMLGTSTPTRSRHSPDVPTFAEIGMKAAESSFWGGFFAPPGTPTALVERMAKVIVEVADSAAFKTRIEGAGLVPLIAGTDTFARLYAADRDRMKAAVAASGTPLI